ncbi:MAG TPA: glycosyltransferase [Bryobacteraceae bacterium]|jgi:hypothetical protein|nr:glycosyltransferase [Bryobacteraceae bacterium]
MAKLTPQPEVPEHQAPRISVVIVSLDRVDQLRASIEALGTDHQIVFVDNGSTDGAEMLNEEFPHLHFSRLPRNFGLVKALNIGLRSAEGEYILCLHDDVLISAEAVGRLADYLETHPDVGAVCPLLTDNTGAPIAQVRSLPTPAEPDPPFSPPTGGEEQSVACVSGAAIMFRSFFLRSLRQVDERYGTYGSSIEICAKVKSAAKKVVILHSVTAIHENDGSPVPKSALEGDRAAGTAIFLTKHHGLVSGLFYRLKTGLAALFTFRFSVLSGAISGQKIDGTG